MLNKNFAATSAMIGRAPKMVIEQPHFTKQEDWGQVMSKFLTDYKNQTNENELKSALQSGDEEAINKAAAAYDPKGFYDAMQKIKATREASDLDFERKKELLGIKNQYDIDAAEKTAALAREIARIKSGGKGLVNINMGAGEDVPVVDTAQMGLDKLQDIADRDSIGAWTRFRKGLKLTTDQEEKDLGAISSSIAAIAPEAISKLKAAGVSGINTMAEFLTYLGLPENPTSQEIAGALPQISAIIGKSGNAGGQQTQANYKSKYGLE